jgi:hypothetical protein
MGENNRTSEYLEPFLDGTPLALERIKLAWLGLSLRDRAYLLSILLADARKEPLAMRWSRQREALIDLALDDENSYIRYLAAKHVAEPGKGDDASAVARYRKVESDKAGLVQAGIEESRGLLFRFGLFSDKPDRFWKLPQISRLALANGALSSIIADYLRYASKELLPNGLVTVDEMFDVLLQFLGPEMAREIGVPNRQRYEIGTPNRKQAASSREPDNTRRLEGIAEELWKLIPDVPELLSYILLSCLPEPAYVPVPREVLDALDDDQLKFLLSHNEIPLKELRRKVFTESANRELRKAAVSSQNFELSNSDISRLVFDPNETKESGNRKREELVILAEACGGATLVQMEAISDFIKARKDAIMIESESNSHDYYAQARRAKSLAAESLETEILEMRIYELAKRLSTSNPDEEFSQLLEKLGVHQEFAPTCNSWQTYLNLCNVPLKKWKRSKTDLPGVYIPGFDLPDDSEADESEQDAHRAFDLLTEVQNSVKNVSEQELAELSTLSAALTEVSAQVQEAGALTEQRFIGLQKELNILLWALGAILLLLIFRLL